MSYSDTYTVAETKTFTVTHARHMAAKVATDLKRMQRLYGKPGDIAIANYETEITEFLREGYLRTATYGFRRDDKWIEPTLRYTARDLAGSAANDDDPGRVRPGANIDGATAQPGTACQRPKGVHSRGACPLHEMARPNRV